MLDVRTFIEKTKGARLIRKYEKTNNAVVSGIVGAAIGDAIGVPVEFQYREQLSRSPVTGMQAHGTHNQPAGTWSDDTSMMLATASALSDMQFDPGRIATAFLDWRDHGAFSPDEKVFDIGLTTNTALNRFKEGTDAVLCGGNAINDNGNGSLMRILPMAFFLYDTVSFESRKQIVHDASSITHRHLISKIACHFYVEFIIWLVRMKNKDMRATTTILQAYDYTAKFFRTYYENNEEVGRIFSKIFTGELSELSIHIIKSGGYVVDSLEAALWCLLHTDSYETAVLTAVNLGHDTDTIGCITGGAAGVIYGIHNIPMAWKKTLRRSDMVYGIADNFAKKCQIKSDAVS